MKKTANEIQKERKKEIEDKAKELIKQCDVATLTSINEKGYPRTCVLAIAKAEGFFKKGIDDPKFRVLKFHTIEATFWIEGKFRTCKYK